MAYKLLDQNGNKFVINGMNKGYIKVPYNYQGLDLSNVNTAPSRYDNPFYSDVKCIYINGKRYNAYIGTNHKFIPEAYAPTQITISGRRWNEGYDHYEIYLNNQLVSTGVFPNEVNTDVYVINKEANTSVVIMGEWDSTNSKYIYNVLTNAIIPMENSYQWDNNTYSATIEFTVGASRDITTTQSSTQLNLPSLDTIKKKIKSKTKRVVRKITKVEVYGGEPLYWEPGSEYNRRPWLASNSSGYSPDSPYIIGSTSSSTSRKVFGSGYVDVTRIMSETSTTPFYGWMQVGTGTDYYRMNGGSKGALCNSSGNLPTFKIRVTYEY